MVDREKDTKVKVEMTMSEAGRKGGERGKELIEKGKQNEREKQQV